MGLPGSIYIEITTTFDSEKNSASRTVRYISGFGLNMLVSCGMSDPDYWEINRLIMADTMELKDGIYRLVRKHVGPGQFDYKWAPTDKSPDQIDQDD